MSKLDKVSEVKVVDTQLNTELVYRTETEPKKSTLGTSFFGTLNSKGIAKLQSLGHTINNESDYCSLLRATFGLAEDEIGNRGPKWDTLESRQRYKVYIDGLAFEPGFTAKQKAKIEEMEIAVPKIPQMNAQPTAILPPTPVVPQAIVPQAVVPPMPTIPATADTQAVIPQVPVVAVVPPVVAQAIVPTAIVPQAVIPPVQVPADTLQVVVPQAIIPPTAEEVSYVAKMKELIAQGKWTEQQLISSLSDRIGLESAARVYSLAK